MFLPLVPSVPWDNNLEEGGLEEIYEMLFAVVVQSNFCPVEKADINMHHHGKEQENPGGSGSRRLRNGSHTAEFQGYHNISGGG